MIGILGAKRIMLLLSLAGMGAFLAVFYFYYLLPQKDRTEIDLRRTKAETVATQDNVNTLKYEIDQFESKKLLFEKLQQLGFFNDQDRVLARERFEAMQKMSRVLSAKYEIKPAQIEQNEIAKEAGYGILNSEISVSLEALDDVDIYRFVYLMNYAFPGHVTIKDISINRKMSVTQAVLKQIGSGEKIALVSAKLSAEWRTMAPEKDLGIQQSTEFGE